MKIQAVIFDMDGVLVDSEPHWRRVEVDVFNSLGVPLNEAMCAQTIGLRIDEVVDYWAAAHPWDESTSPRVSVASLIVDKMEEALREQAEALPGVRQAVKLFAGLGLKLAVASSSYERLISAAVERLGVGSHFAALCSAEHEKFGKPHPAVYLSAAKALGVEGSQCLAIEDSLNGLRSAKAAQMQVLAVPELKRPQGIDQECDFLLPSLLELKLEHLEQWGLI